MMLNLLKEHKVKYLTGTLMLGIVDPLSNIVIANLIMVVFDEAVYNASLVFPVVAKFLLLTAALAIIAPLGRYLIDIAALNTTASLREVVLNKLIKLDQAELTQAHTGDYISRGTNDIQVVEGLYKEQFQHVCSVLLNGIGCAVAMLLLDWRFSLGLIAYQLLMLFLVSRFAKPLKKASDALQETLAKVTEKTVDLLGGYQ